MFSLSQEFGAWRVLSPDRSWRVDLSPIHGGSLDADLRLRDLTVNAIAEPLAGGELVDPTGGRGGPRRARAAHGRPGLRSRTTRCGSCGVARLALALGFAIDPATRGRGARRRRRPRPGLRRADLRRAQPPARERRGARRHRAARRRRRRSASCCRRSPRCDGVEQNRYHDRDVLGHTLEVLEEAIAPRARPGPGARRRARPTRCAPCSPSRSPTACPRSMGLRWGALLHDAAKPATRVMRDDGEVGGFPGHDVAGRRARPRRPHPAEGERATARARRGADPPPPAPRLPRAQPAARRARPLRLPHGDRAGRGRRHAAVRRRPPRHPRPQVRGGDRAPRRARPRGAARDPGLAGRRRATRAAGARRRTRAGGSASTRAGARARCCARCRRPSTPARSRRPTRPSSSRGGCSARPEPVDDAEHDVDGVAHGAEVDVVGRVGRRVVVRRDEPLVDRAEPGDAEALRAAG